MRELLLPAGEREAWGPQRPEERLSNNPADDGEGGQDKPDPAIERNSILVGHKALRSSHITDNVDAPKPVAKGNAEDLAGDPLLLDPIHLRDGASLPWRSSWTNAYGGCDPRRPPLAERISPRQLAFVEEWLLSRRICACVLPCLNVDQRSASL